MDGKVVIDCIGPSVLTITISGATHSVSIATDVIKVSGPGQGVDHNLDCLPLIYDAAGLAGRLNICDGAGKMVYCWRSSIMLQSTPTASLQERHEVSSSSPLPPIPRTEVITSHPSLASSQSNGSEKHGGTSVRIGDTSGMPTESFAAKVTPGGKSSHGMKRPRDNTFDDNVQEPVGEPKGPVDTLCKVGQHIDRESGRKKGGSYINLEDEDADQQISKLTVAQKVYLISSINKLSTLGWDDFWQMDLNIMKSKLHNGLYSSIETLEADIDQLEHSSVTENGPHHKHTELARDLRAVFHLCTTGYPGKDDEDSAPRKRAKTMGSKTPPAQKPARTPASSPPRAAKTAMKGRKYPRDHW